MKICTINEIRCIFVCNISLKGVPYNIIFEPISIFSHMTNGVVIVSSSGSLKINVSFQSSKHVIEVLDTKCYEEITGICTLIDRSIMLL